MSIPFQEPEYDRDEDYEDEDDPFYIPPNAGSSS